MALAGKIQRLRILPIVVLLPVVFAAVWAGWALWQRVQEAELRAGISALKEGDYSTALTKIQPFALAGNQLAQTTLGDMYAYGLGVAADDVRARIWFRRAECQCPVSGRFEYGVGLDYLGGHAVQQDEPKALEWIRHSAEAGYLPAQSLLADERALAAKGLTVDPFTANYWRRVLESGEGMSLE